MTVQEFEVILNELTEARDALNKLQLDLQTAKAERYLSVKQHPAKYGLEKATENTIEAVINTSADILEQENAVIAAKRRQGECFAKYDLAKYELDLAKLNQVTE